MNITITNTTKYVITYSSPVREAHFRKFKGFSTFSLEKGRRERDKKIGRLNILKLSVSPWPEITLSSRFVPLRTSECLTFGRLKHAFVRQYNSGNNFSTEK